MTLLHTLSRRPSTWSFAAALAAWAISIIWAEGRGAIDLLRIALTFAAFTSLVSFGQMLVVTSGPGHVDLSIPSVIVMASAISMVFMDGDNARILPGVVLTLVVCLAAGVFNHLLIRRIAIPPIIATLASGLIIMSVAIVFGRGMKIKPPTMFESFVNYKFSGGIPLLGVLAVVIGILFYVMLERTRYGRSVCAIGQNERAAALSGIDVQRVRLITYCISAVLAGVTGMLIAGFAGGNSLDQGAEYLLLTVAVVVIGGTAVTGGRPSVAGIIGASLFMFLLVTMLNTVGANAGIRSLLTGAIIMAVISIIGGETHV